MARVSIRTVLDALWRNGFDVKGCGLLAASGKPQTSLEATLASHAMIHSAEGDLFRDAIVRAAERLGLTVNAVKEKDLFDRVWSKLRIDPEKLQAQINGMGRTLGPPWTQDEKRAAIVAWLALRAK